MTRFLYRVLRESKRFEPQVILLATSASDSASVMLRRPSTWLHSPRVVEEVDRDLPYIHVGAWLSELEFQRYHPRRELTQLLKKFDILQFVAGAAPWVEAAASIDKPKCLWVATTIVADRTSRADTPLSPRSVWSALMTRIAAKYERRALKLADSVLALSPYTSRSLAPMLDGGESQLAFCGVDTSLFHPRDSNSRQAAIGEGYILCVARLFDARKNVAMLLRAYAALVQNRPDFPDLVLVGEPLSAEGLRMLTGLGIEQKVRCHGPTHGSELADLYRGATMFVLPSDEEGLGIVILEAMASGLPVVSTASGGPEVLVEDGVTGFLTPVGDQKALESAITTLLDDHDLRYRMGAAARSAAEAKFSLAATGAVFIEQYDRLLAAG